MAERGGMEQKAIRGVRWTFLGFASTRLLTFVTTVVLARLLVPSDFGLLALASFSIGVFGIVSDFGLWAALVLRPDFDRRAEGTVLTTMVTTRAVLCVLIIGFAQVADDIFREPRLTEVLSVLAVTVFIGGLTWFYDALLHRDLEFSKRFAAQLADAVTFATVVIILASLGAGVWSLVFGQIARLLAYTVVVLAVRPYWVRPAFDRKAARDAMSSGSGFVVQGGVAFLSQNADYFAVGRVLGAGQLGLYSMAYGLGELPSKAVAEPVAQVTFPGFARMRHRGSDFVPSFLSILHLVALVACPIGVLLSATADPFTHTLYGDKWAGMIGALSVMGIWAAVRTIDTTIAWLLNSIGEAAIMGAIAAGFVVLLVPGVYLAADQSGLTAVAWVMLANLVASLLSVSLVASRRGGVGLRQQWAAIRAPVVAGAFCWAAARLVADGLDGASDVVALAAAVAAGLVVYGATASVVEPGVLRRSFEQGRRIAGREPADDTERPETADS